MRVRARVVALIALFVLPGLVAAEAPRQMQLRSDLMGWEAVGRVDVAGNGYCTGVLIADDLVLTAAHCLFFRDTGAPVPPEQVVFRAGYMNGRALAERRGARLAMPEAYEPSRDGSIRGDMVRHDVALLRLAEPIGAAVADPFRVHVDPRPGDEVSVVSYGEGRSEAPARQRRCRLLDEAPGIMVFDCDVTFGSSGAPVFVRYGTRARILALVSSMGGPEDGPPRSFGAPLAEVVPELRRRLRHGDAPVAGPSPGARRVTVGGAPAAVGGARFVRP
ncbi:MULTISPECIES: serine protease [unclassified Rhodosalinus]|uniref:trypsin-like serine peptidase n=1 Tax=unclassified Rhodosalinus TaxID=2630183 RepID=UPI0035239867